LQKYFPRTQGISEGRKLRDQAIHGANLDRRELGCVVAVFFSDQAHEFFMLRLLE
jgi:hypothetical protein